LVVVTWELRKDKEMQGIGSMLFELGGGNKHDPAKYYGKVIEEAWEGDKGLNLKFTDGSSISIWDDGQSCCESRYMQVEDDLSILKGKTLKEIKVKSTGDGEYEYGEHEICFLEISTSDPVYLTFSFHNEHNGYYGGFGLRISELDKDGHLVWED
jgi:hypothetical protein